MSVRVFAPAKINLTLEVGRPRADGRHPLQSAVMFADVGDWIEAEADTDRNMLLYVRGPFGAALHDAPGNIVYDAIGVMQKASAVERGGRITLEKNLPIASGIGGGSADAAATLKALRDLWALNLTDEDLAAISRDLGADVPVCVAARSAWMTGAGETVAPMRAPTLNAVLVNPLKPLSTAEVYRQFDRMELGDAFAPRSAPAWRNADEAIAAIKAIGNDLEAPARALMPEIGAAIDALAQDPRALHVAMSGSGATVFGLCAAANEAQAMANDVARRHPDWWVRRARLG
ncbi:MAG TPA: 4-(cytidine 5'-diphospho)-2-C-methyl-D-erythritol kinase [Caulobacterales bacterium]|nr:4-(cytidine 5'-diphospho)-2-C-methyl-D-erythritol kinase [Caulobacterales bacterium]